MPQFSYASSSQPNLSLIGHFGDHDRSSPDFPLPSVLVGNEDPFENDLKYDPDILIPTLSNKKSEIISTTDTAPPATESFENRVFDFNAFETLENDSHTHASLCRKRAASPTPLKLEAKSRRMTGHKNASKAVGQKEHDIIQEEVKHEVEAKQPLPEWVAEFDQDLIAFFGDSVVYAE
jgi:hypothetical protein